jgi:hypothetical protein
MGFLNKIHAADEQAYYAEQIKKIIKHIKPSGDIPRIKISVGTQSTNWMNANTKILEELITVYEKHKTDDLLAKD